MFWHYSLSEACLITKRWNTRRDTTRSVEVMNVKIGKTLKLSLQQAPQYLSSFLYLEADERKMLRLTHSICFPAQIFVLLNRKKKKGATLPPKSPHSVFGIWCSFNRWKAKMLMCGKIIFYYKCASICGKTKSYTFSCINR